MFGYRYFAEVRKEWQIDASHTHNGTPFGFGVDKNKSNAQLTGPVACADQICMHKHHRDICFIRFAQRWRSGVFLLLPPFNLHFFAFSDSYRRRPKQKPNKYQNFAPHRTSQCVNKWGKISETTAARMAWIFRKTTLSYLVPIAEWRQSGHVVWVVIVTCVTPQIPWIFFRCYFVWSAEPTSKSNVTSAHQVTVNEKPYRDIH